MKTISKIACLAMAVAVCSCSSDEPGGGTQAPSTGDGVYSLVNFKLPQTRSASSEGTEVGKDFENNIGSILVIMADDQNKFVSFALNDAPITNAQTNTYTITFHDKETLMAYAGKTVNIYAVCNPTEQIRASVAGNISATTGEYEGGLAQGADFQDLIFTGDVYSTWKNNGFLMTSVEANEVTLPDAATLREKNSPTNPVDLGTCEVQRTMSRFDIRDAATGSTPFTYDIKNPDTNQVQGSVTFTRVALFNLADRFYYLPRTNTALCPGTSGMEVTGTDYVVSPAARLYTEALPSTGEGDSRAVMAIDPLNPTASLKWSKLSDIIAGDEDNDDSEWTDNVDPYQGYHIWRYATENTFPTGDDNTIFNTTGYVFEAQINVADDFGNVNADGSKEVMYLYRDVLYANAMAIAAKVAEVPVSTLATAFEGAFDITRDSDGNIISATPKSDSVVEAMGFTAYKPNSEGKYLCYYFAFNTHNDNSDKTTVGVMEYATVRNNVYKLAVTSVKKFGGFKPGDDIEEWDTYFTLNVRVLPWVVRVNNIEF